MAITHQGPATTPIVGEAEVRGRRVSVRWAEGTLEGHPELVTRLERVAGGTPPTAIDFLRALRSLGGTVVSSDVAVSGRGAVTLSGSASLGS